MSPLCMQYSFFFFLLFPYFVSVWIEKRNKMCPQMYPSPSYSVSSPSWAVSCSYFVFFDAMSAHLDQMNVTERKRYNLLQWIHCYQVHWRWHRYTNTRHLAINVSWEEKHTKFIRLCASVHLGHKTHTHIHTHINASPVDERWQNKNTLCRERETLNTHLYTNVPCTHHCQPIATCLCLLLVTLYLFTSSCLLMCLKVNSFVKWMCASVWAHHNAHTRKERKVH